MSNDLTPHVLCGPDGCRPEGDQGPSAGPSEYWQQHMMPELQAAIERLPDGGFPPESKGGQPVSEAAWVMAHRLVATALMMKRQFQDAGMMVAREFCTEHGIDVYGIERTLRFEGKPHEIGRAHV